MKKFSSNSAPRGLVIFDLTAITTGRDIMDRLLILTVFVAACNAGHLGYNYNYNNRQYDNIEQYPPLSNREELTKSFYFFTAPEDDNVPPPITNRVIPKVKKNVQVVVIKAPEYNDYANAAAKIAQQAVQTRTVIYVLSKQPDLADLERRIQEIQDVTHQKPEVRFVKYRTPEEANYAQQAIKSQYDNLSGTSSFLNTAGTPTIKSQVDFSGTSSFLNAAGTPTIKSQYDNLSGRSNGLNAAGAPIVENVDEGASDDDDIFTVRRPPFLPSGIDVVPGSSYLPPKRD